ncbi:MAG TPA: hypothetical protein VIL74_20605 [Pyrinomonadaceae bacterium]|jgi:hypothetical protein
MAITDFEELDLTVLNVTQLGWSAPLLTADFGGGYQAGALSAPYGLHRWSLSADLIPDLDEYSIDYDLDGSPESDPRFTYLFEFIKRHLLLGNKPFLITDPRTGLKFLVSFAGRDFSFNQITAKIFAGGVEIVERRVGDLLFNGDGSIDEDEEPPDGPESSDTVLTCGFECAAGTMPTPHWQTASGFPLFASIPARGNGRSMKTNCLSSASSCVIMCTRAAAEIQVGRVYVYFDTLPSHDTKIVGADNLAADGALSVAYKASDSKLYCSIGTGNSYSFGVGGVAVTTDQWYRIDFKFDHSDGAKKVDAAIDGAALGQKTSTGAGGFASAKITLGLTLSAAQIFFDCFTLSESESAYPIGVGTVRRYILQTDGSHNTGGAANFETPFNGYITDATTESWENITDLSGNSYVTQIQDSGGGSNYVEHIFSAHDGVPDDIAPRCVEVAIAYHQQGSGVGNSSIRLVDDGTENVVKDFSGAGSTALAHGTKHYQKMPKDDAAWALVRFLALRMRFGFSTDANPDQHFDGAIIEADFAE